MMVVTAKLKKRNILIILAAVAAVLLLLFWPGKKDGQGTDRDLAKTAAQRAEFLRSFGWIVDDEPTETQEVKIPKESNQVFDRYNELQKSQGYDLSKYAGKTVTRYVYQIRNHPDTGEEYRATIFVYDGKVIGGDVASTAYNGIMHGFKMPT